MLEIHSLSGTSEFSQCAVCGGRLRILTALTDPASIHRYLLGVGLPMVPRRWPRLSRILSSPSDLPLAYIQRFDRGSRKCLYYVAVELLRLYYNKRERYFSGVSTWLR